MERYALELPMVSLSRSGISIATFGKQAGLYMLLEAAPSITSNASTVTTSERTKRINSGISIVAEINHTTSQPAPVLDWHRRFGHASAASIELMARQSLADGLTVNPVDERLTAFGQTNAHAPPHTIPTHTRTFRACSSRAARSTVYYLTTPNTGWRNRSDSRRLKILPCPGRQLHRHGLVIFLSHRDQFHEAWWRKN